MASDVVETLSRWGKWRARLGRLFQAGSGAGPEAGPHPAAGLARALSTARGLAQGEASLPEANQVLERAIKETSRKPYGLPREQRVALKTLRAAASRLEPEDAYQLLSRGARQILHVLPRVDAQPGRRDAERGRRLFLSMPPSITRDLTARARLRVYKTWMKVLAGEDEGSTLVAAHQVERAARALKERKSLGTRARKADHLATTLADIASLV